MKRKIVSLKFHNLAGPKGMEKEGGKRMERETIQAEQMREGFEVEMVRWMSRLLCHLVTHERVRVSLSQKSRHRTFPYSFSPAYSSGFWRRAKNIGRDEFHFLSKCIVLEKQSGGVGWRERETGRWSLTRRRKRKLEKRRRKDGDEDERKWTADRIYFARREGKRETGKVYLHFSLHIQFDGNPGHVIINVQIWITNFGMKKMTIKKFPSWSDQFKCSRW